MTAESDGTAAGEERIRESEPDPTGAPGNDVYSRLLRFPEGSPRGILYCLGIRVANECAGC